MLRRWRVAAYDCEGTWIDDVDRAWTWWGAQRKAAVWQAQQLEPIEGQRLVEIRVVAP